MRGILKGSEIEGCLYDCKNRTLAKSARMRHPKFKIIQKLAHLSDDERFIRVTRPSVS
jgi:hypothetical protein